MSKVSVLIPTYNGRHTVVRAVESALNQEGVALEVCICDDASTDDTWNILERAYGTNARAHLKRLPENTTGTGALQAATDMATGDYLIRVDQDDWFAADAIRKLAAALDANPRSFVYGQVKYWGRASTVFVPAAAPDFRRHNASLYPYMFPREALAAPCRWHRFEAGPDGPGDWDFALQLIEAGYQPNPQPDVMVLHYVLQSGTQIDRFLANQEAYLAELRARHPGVYA